MNGESCHPGLVPYDFFPSLSLKKKILLSAEDTAGTGVNAVAGERGFDLKGLLWL